MDYDDDAAMATCWSKGDNGGGEGELVLYGAGNDSGAGSNERDVIESKGEDLTDYGNNGNTLTGNSYGSGGGCVVFTIHLYRGDKLGKGDGSNVSHDRGGSFGHDREMSSDAILQSLSTIRPNPNPYHKHQASFVNLSSSYGIGASRLSSSRESLKSSSSHASHSTSNESGAKPDFSHGIIVECMRVRGDTIQFHKDCRAIFASARGNSDGLDDYRSPKSSLYHSPFGFKRLRPISLLTRDHHQLFMNNVADGIDDDYNIQDEYEDCDDTVIVEEENHPNLIQMKFKRTPSELTNSTFSALERVLDLLEKDRFDAQLLGVKSLLLLTDKRSSGLECSYMTSLCILGSKMRFSHSSMNRKQSNQRYAYRGSTSHGEGGTSRGGNSTELCCNTSWTAEMLHQKVLSIAKGKIQSGSRTKSSYNTEFCGEHYEEEDEDEDFVDFSNPSRKERHSSNNTTVQSKAAKRNTVESQYNATIRGYMTHILSNALNNLIQNSDQFPLLPQPKCSEFMTKDFIEKISQDVAGATRPPMALLGTAHEATHAVKFLHLLASYSEEGFRAVHSACIGDGPMIVKKRPIMELLDKAYDVGLSSHHVLKLESKTARDALTGFYK